MSKYYAFFDLDHTLLDANSGRFLLLEAYRQKIIPLTMLRRAIRLSLAHKMGLRQTTSIIDDLGKILVGMDVVEVSRIASEIMPSRLVKRLRSESLMEMESHRKAGAALYILSSAMEEVCEPVCRFLKMDGYLCSTMERRQGYYTGEVVGKYCYGDEKLVRLQAFASENKVALMDTWYYADDLSDVPVFESVGHPVCVHPARNLKKLAMARNWKILE